LLLARPQSDQPLPIETIAAVAPDAPWHPRMVVTSPAATIPSSAARPPVDVLAYLGLAGRIAGAGVLALAATVLLLVVAYRWFDPPTSTLMLGQRLSGTAIEQTWVPLERISPNLVHAVILSEDGGFCRHRGVDWTALGQAIENDRGGSTITMQVVKNLFLWPSRSYVRKALEIMLAYLVEVVWPKQRVLEIYLNIAEWGPGVFGAEAAARHHFGKAASRLTAQEASLLAVSLPSPLEREAGYPGYQQRRLASNLLTRMRAVRTRPCVRTRRGEG
jgi:monofunctional biosynthetic peptidoglycan transglycosylase